MNHHPQALALAVLLVLGCSGRSPDAPAQPAGPVAPSQPPPAPATVAPPPPPRPPRPANAPCSLVLERGTERVPWVEYEYGGPTTCVLPPELLVHGCPTMVHELSVNAPEREAVLRLTYDDAGRLVHWTSTFPRTGELLEDATVSYDEQGRPIGIARAPGWSSDAWYGWTQTADTTFAWGDHEVVLERGMFRVVYQLDAAGRRTHHEVQYSGQVTYRADWIYDGDRLDRIEETALITGGTMTVHRYAYDCP